MRLRTVGYRRLHLRHFERNTKLGLDKFTPCKERKMKVKDDDAGGGIGVSAQKVKKQRWNH